MNLQSVRIALRRESVPSQCPLMADRQTHANGNFGVRVCPSLLATLRWIANRRPLNLQRQLPQGDYADHEEPTRLMDSQIPSPLNGLESTRFKFKIQQLGLA